MRKLFLFGLMILLSETVFAEEQGRYFAKKTYDHQPLPTYEQSKDQLPVPIYDGNKEWVGLYWTAWKTAFSRLQSPQSGSPFVSNWIDEGLCPQIFQWDTNFMAMFGRYAHHIFPFIGSQDNFYCSQHADGMIDRVINESDGKDYWWGQGPDNARAINPPLFSWAEVQTYMATGDKSRFAMVLEPLERYVQWIEAHRRGYDTPHQLYWTNGQASGMDNTPRDNGRQSPEKDWDCHSAIDHMGWVDMSSQMVMCYRDLSYICKELGKNDKARLYSMRADSISTRINKWLWDDQSGLYFDVTPAGNKTKCISAATFWPMLAGVANHEQCAKLVKNLKNTSLFWRPIPVPSLAANQPEYDKMGCYWKGGVWAPTNYMIVEGLKKSGFSDVAIDVSKRYINALLQVYNSTGTLWEAYSPEIYSPATNASGKVLVQPNFVGWTGLGPISMLIETIIGIEMDAPHNTIAWNITADCRNGVQNLMFNGGRVSLVATPVSGGYEVEISSEKDLKAVITVGGKVQEMKIEPGSKVTKMICS
jgi:glycogen debranching enzyme